MKRFFFAICLFCCFYATPLALIGQDSNAKKKGKLITADDSMFYAFGHSIISGMPAEGVAWNAKKFKKGVKDQLKQKGKMNADEALALLTRFGAEMRTRQGAPVTDAAPLSIDPDSLSYGFGLYFIIQLEKIGFPIVEKAFVSGFSDAAKGENFFEDEVLSQSLVQKFNQIANEKTREIQQKESEAAVKKNKELTEGFLAKNKTQPGVITLESGLQYKVVESGDAAGKSPTIQDKVTIHYEGSLLDGTVFDSSYKRGEKASFPLSNLIKGWQIALPLMKPGDKWTLWIPADLAYGNAGSPPSIPAGALIIFDIAYFGIAE